MGNNLLMSGPPGSGKAISARNAYKGDVFHDLDARIATARVNMLVMFARKRWPKVLL